MASSLVVRGSPGTTTNPDQRQRMIEQQAASKAAFTKLPEPSPAQRPLQASSPPSTATSQPMTHGAAGFATSLIAQRLSKNSKAYPLPGRPGSVHTTRTHLRDIVV